MRPALNILALLLFGLCTFTTASPYGDWELARNIPRDPEAEVGFLVMLRQQNLDILKQRTLEAADPLHPSYSRWLTRSEVLDTISPPAKVTDTVISWIRKECSSSELSEVLNLRDAIQVTTNVACTERLFGATLVTYENSKTGARILRQDVNGKAPQIPSELEAHIDIIAGLSDFPPSRSDILVQPRAASPVGAIIPESIRAQYKIPSNSYITNPSVSQTAYQFSLLENPLSTTDLFNYAQGIGEPYTNFSAEVGYYGFSSNGDVGESTLDYSLIGHIGGGAFTWYMIAPPWGGYFYMAAQIFNMPSPPLVVSISYGGDEIYSYINFNGSCLSFACAQNSINRVNTELMKLGSIGISVVVSSGDDGAAGISNTKCNLDGTVQSLNPTFPASSPWVTAVGATLITNSTTLASNCTYCTSTVPSGAFCSAGNGIEVAATYNNTPGIFTTGGGFSIFSPRPSYQDAAVTAYLSSSSPKPPAAYFNSTGRGYPDIAAVGCWVPLVIGGSWSGFSFGTSASAPIIGGIISLLNQYRLNTGQGPLGFLNPLLYQMAKDRPSAFTTVKSGNNKCSTANCCLYGYQAWDGWSPVGGLGTPVYPEILAYLQQVAPANTTSSSSGASPSSFLMGMWRD